MIEVGEGLAQDGETVVLQPPCWSFLLYLLIPRIPHILGNGNLCRSQVGTLPIKIDANMNRSAASSSLRLLT